MARRLARRIMHGGVRGAAFNPAITEISVWEHNGRRADISVIYDDTTAPAVPGSARVYGDTYIRANAHRRTVRASGAPSPPTAMCSGGLAGRPGY